MTEQQVLDLMSVNIRAMEETLPAANVIKNTNGTFAVAAPEGGVASAATPEFQVMFVYPDPSEKGGQFFMVFLQNGKVIGQQFSDATAGTLVSDLLKGKKVTTTGSNP